MGTGVSESPQVILMGSQGWDPPIAKGSSWRLSLFSSKPICSLFNNIKQHLELNSPQVFSMIWTVENRTHSHPLNEKLAEKSSFEQSYLIFLPSCNHVFYGSNLLSIFSHLFIFYSFMLYPWLPLLSHMHYLALIFITLIPKDYTKLPLFSNLFF